MINQSKVTDFNRNDDELEEWALFCFAAAGKSSFTIAPRLDALLRGRFECDMSPFNWVNSLIIDGQLVNQLKECGLGQFKRTERCWSEMILHKNPRQWTLDQLLSIHGVGNKSARFFLLHSRPDQQVAVLDTHILRWLRDQGYDAPKISPTHIKTYKKWENVFLCECSKQERDPAEMDLSIWNEYSRKVKVAA
jgi:thermostable 8-oxoguanine DNA glycosylase